jgi:hypothetical protein
LFQSLTLVPTLFLTILLAAPAPGQEAPASGQDDVQKLAAELLSKKDDADPAVIEKLGASPKRAAAEGLASAYEAMQSIFMRREVVRALARIAASPEAETVALEKIAQVAGSTDDPEVRDAALLGLAQSPRLGRRYLKQIVDAAVEDSIREQALRLHVKQAAPDDAEWYRYLWNVKEDRRKDAEGKVLGMELQPIREVAFDGLAPFLNEDQMVEALRMEKSPKIRRAALKSMHERKMAKTSEMATWLLERVDAQGSERAEAARLLVVRDGAKAFPIFLELAKKRDVTTEDLRHEMARLISAQNDDATDKKLVRLIGKGKPHERVFALIATQHMTDPKVLQAVRKELDEKEVEIRRAAAQSLGSRRDKESLPLLHTMLRKPKNPQDQSIAIDAISAIEQGGSKWLAELAELCTNPDRDTRNAALEQLAQARSTRFLEALATALAHDDWTTRWIAIAGLESLRDKAAVPRLIARLEKEGGRLRRRIADALWKLTAQTYEEDFAQWQAWWQREGANFKVVAQAEFDKAERDRENKRLRQRTRAGAKFFGIRLESHRVIFIVDVSGSMLESVYGHNMGKAGKPRIDVARDELMQCIKNLDPTAKFNVFAFSNGVERWRKEGVADNNDENRQAALTWVERLGAAGGTNIFDSLELAFQDKEVDTIYFLSDGEPSVGALIDPHRIREEVAFWNRHRRVKIHTIAVGGNFEILEWLAKDSGGDHVKIR